MPINLGDAFIIETPPNREHLFIAIAPLPGGNYLFVNTSTVRSNTQDRACILIPGTDMHPFIRSESYIVYREARKYTNAALDTAIANRSCRPRGRFSPAILRTIQEGGLVSRFLANEYKAALRNCLNL